jgi:hypothetical protein
MVRSASYYWNDTIAQYRASANPGGVLLLSGIQNLLSNVIGISNIYTSLSSNINTQNLTGTWYDVGRLTRILVIFPVIQPVNSSEVYNPNAGSTINRLLLNRQQSSFTSAAENILTEVISFFPNDAVR